MIDARNYLVSETLKNGMEVVIRASRPEDLDLVIAAFHALERESIYTRYFAFKNAPSEGDIRSFREADFKTRVILLCTMQREGTEVVIANALYVRTSDTEAEVAFTVEEDYQRLGIAGSLLKHLGIIATDAGLKVFTAEVLPINEAMLGVFSRCGWPMTSEQYDGTIHITMRLTS